MGETLKIFVAGLVSIGVITALFMNGRQTVAGITATGNAGSKLLDTSIKG